MNRYPPQNVIKILRNECIFMCSINGCDVPYLEYHHFDPPWHIENHHNTEGMIVLCPVHHRQADVGAWNIAQLHELKRANKEIDLSQVEGKFNYLRNKFLLKAGGIYAFNNRFAEITLEGKPLIWFENVDENFKALNIELFDKDYS